MDKKLNAYMTVEAAYIMPLVLALHLLVLVSGFYVYDRCVVSQDLYLLAFRGSRFTECGNHYGAVVYGDLEVGKFDKEYIEQRYFYQRTRYPFWDKGKAGIGVNEDKLQLSQSGFFGHLVLRKEAQWINPIAEIREKRRGKYA